METGGSSPDTGPPLGVNVAGLLRADLGIGEAARSVIKSLDAVGVSVLPVQGRWVPTCRQGHEFACLHPAQARWPINLVCINPGELPLFMADAGPDFRSGRYTIGFWWWEPSVFPKRWHTAFDMVDEIWVGTDHVARTVRSATELPVTTVRMPVVLPHAPPMRRQALGLPDTFVFLFMFDFHSTFARKNPMGVVEAFQRAFPADERVSLVIKCINQGSDPGNYAQLLDRSAKDPRVQTISRYVSEDERTAMLGAADCYVSLHRAEGFALTLAEAMSLGTPVVATRYSGNLEFMDDDNSYLVDCTLREITDNDPPYQAGDGVWAEPDVEHAARLMRSVRERPDEAHRRARQAARDIAREFSLHAAGTTMLNRLRTIQAAPELARPASGAIPACTTSGSRRGIVPIATVLPSFGQWLSVWQAVRTMVRRESQRRRVWGAMMTAGRELLQECRRRIELRRDRVALPSSSRPVEVSGLLSQIRSHEATLRDLEARLALLEHQRAPDE